MTGRTLKELGYFVTIGTLYGAALYGVGCAIIVHFD